jgi:hypothetical protein
MPPGSGAPRELVLSYLELRKAVGIIGVALPLVLPIGKWVIQSPGLEPSISCYYYTDMGNVFVGSLCAIGIFLMSTKGYDWRDEVAGILACIFAIGVALFPTTPCPGAKPGDPCVGHLHLAFAALLFLTLAYFSIMLFTKTEPNKESTDMTPQKRQRNKVYRFCGWTIVASIVLIAVVKLTRLEASLASLTPVFWLESLAIVAFGVSWLTKGETILKDR